MKLLTLNTHSLLEENSDKKLKQFVETILKEKPDIIALQEVNQSIDAPVANAKLLAGWMPCQKSGSKDEIKVPVRNDNYAAHAARLLREAGFSCSWTWVPAKIGYEKYDEGMAILCAGKTIQATDTFFISGCRDYSDWKTRRVLGVQISGSKDWFYTVHMGWWNDDKEPFLMQWKRLNKALQEKKKGSAIWLLGDFNSPAQFRNQSYDCICESGWVDTYKSALTKDSGITVEGVIDGWREFTEGDKTPEGMRMDHIWCSKDLPVKSSRVLFNGINEPKVSDHFGVLIEIMEEKPHERRTAGILLSITSLPSKYGIGCFSKSAYNFVDWLVKAEQSYWQILPLGPVSYGDSPYQSFSTFAGSPYFISLETLIEEGVLTVSECDEVDLGSKDNDIDYEKLYNNRYSLLYKAYKRSDIAKNKNYQQFVEENKWWLCDYALFMAVKDSLGGIPWNQWPEGIRLREDKVIEKYRRELHTEIEFHQYMQYQFFKQWNELKAYANKKDIRIIGDIPIYVSMDSADTWAHPELFQLDKNNVPLAIAGCPPDGFSATGQLWGNPLYRWEYHHETGYKWWISRLEYCFKMYDVVRIDHFRGFDEYYSIPYGAKTAINGHWEKGPGMELFRTVEKHLGWQEVVAEDLGYVTDSVRQLVKDSGFPGMKVLEFAFDSRDSGSANDYLPHNYIENCVAYTGTHDNETITGWFASITEKERQIARNYLCDHYTPDALLYQSFIGLIMRSSAKICIIPMQDYMGLDNSCRMNKPSTVGTNWRWRIKESELSDELLENIRSMAYRYGRSRNN